jgi:type III pantothenate kinase
LAVKLAHPEKVGVDRLLDAVAANSRRRPGNPAVLIDAGSAVTVDWVDAEGAFCGGAILPGLRLMIESLHRYTALLPLIEVPQEPPAALGTDTRSAMASGVFWSVLGGIEALIARLSAQSPTPPDLFVTGGDAALMHRALTRGMLWPEMTLEGVRLSAVALGS